MDTIRMLWESIYSIHVNAGHSVISKLLNTIFLNSDFQSPRKEINMMEVFGFWWTKFDMPLRMGTQAQMAQIVLPPDRLL